MSSNNLGSDEENWGVNTSSSGLQNPLALNPIKPHQCMQLDDWCDQVINPTTFGEWTDDLTSSNMFNTNNNVGVTTILIAVDNTNANIGENSRFNLGVNTNYNNGVNTKFKSGDNTRMVLSNKALTSSRTYTMKKQRVDVNTKSRSDNRYTTLGKTSSVG